MCIILVDSEGQMMKIAPVGTRPDGNYLHPGPQQASAPQSAVREISYQPECGIDVRRQDFFEQGIGAAFGEQALKRTRTAEAV
jgi:hypothetical protein